MLKKISSVVFSFCFGFTRFSPPVKNKISLCAVTKKKEASSPRWYITYARLRVALEHPMRARRETETANESSAYERDNIIFNCFFCHKNINPKQKERSVFLSPKKRVRKKGNVFHSLPPSDYAERETYLCSLLFSLFLSLSRSVLIVLFETLSLYIYIYSCFGLDIALSS